MSRRSNRHHDSQLSTTLGNRVQNTDLSIDGISDPTQSPTGQPELNVHRIGTEQHRLTQRNSPTYAGKNDYDENKLIRFKAWQDLKEGTWDDLSQFLPSKDVPYYLTPRKEALYLAVFNHEDPGTFDKVYRLTISD